MSRTDASKAQGLGLEQSEDLDLLRGVLRMREDVILAQNKQIKGLCKRIERLTRQNAELRGHQPGEQLELLVAKLQRELDAIQNGGANQTPSSAEGSERLHPIKRDTNGKPQTGHGPREQPKLDQEDVTHSFDEADCICPECGERLEVWPGQEQRSERIHFEPARYILQTHVREKRRCANNTCGHIELADLPASLIKGGRYTPEFGVQVVLEKYLDHLPLQRQVRRMARLGLDVRSQTLWDQVWALACHLKPSYEALVEHILSQQVVGVDQTSWPCLKGKAKQKHWQMWALSSLDAVYYAIEDHKDTATALRLLGEYAGTIVCDDFSTHNAAAKHPSTHFTLSGCWAHVRRRFYKCLKDFPEAKEVLVLIAKLYQIEAKHPQHHTQTAEQILEREALRAIEAKPIVDEIASWLHEHLSKYSKRLSISGAIQYTLANWKKLTRFLDNGAIWIDNNHTERCIRGPVIGRRNHFGSKSERGTLAAAIIYSLVETAKLCDVQPSEYLNRALKNAIQNPGSIMLPMALSRDGPNTTPAKT